MIQEKSLKEIELVLFEYDRRFATAYPDEFVFYDYNRPTALGDSALNDPVCTSARPLPMFSNCCLTGGGMPPRASTSPPSTWR